jgi:hypothetical protein
MLRMKITILMISPELLWIVCLVFQYLDRGDVSYHITVKYNTRIRHEVGQTTVTVVAAPCHGYREERDLLSIEQTDVTFSFTNARGKLLLL